MRSFVCACIIATGVLLSGEKGLADELSDLGLSHEIKVVFSAPSPVLSALVSSSVKAIHYRFGESFVEGAPLLSLDETVYSASADAADAVLKASIVRSEAIKNLHRDGNASLVEQEQACSTVKVAQKNQAEAREKLEGCRIIAPFSGRVIDVLVEEHEFVDVGQPLIRIVNDSILTAQFLLPEEMFAKVKVGVPVKIYVASTQQTVEGIIRYIAAEVDPASCTFEVRAEVNNGAGKLRSGMNATLDRQDLTGHLE